MNRQTCIRLKFQSSYQIRLWVKITHDPEAVSAIKPPRSRLKWPLPSWPFSGLLPLLWPDQVAVVAGLGRVEPAVLLQATALVQTATRASVLSRQITIAPAAMVKPAPPLLPWLMPSQIHLKTGLASVQRRVATPPARGRDRQEFYTHTGFNELFLAKRGGGGGQT